MAGRLGGAVDAFPVSELSPPSTWVCVGEGSFGRVWRASLLGTRVAIKENLSTKDSRVASIKRDITYLR
jgi:serine/threonine-protein kinase 24/25/MST4